MARKPSPSYRTTLYRLTGVEDLMAGIRDKYLDRPEAFQGTVITVGDREAFLVVGGMENERTSWASPLEALTGSPVLAPNRTAAAALIIRDDDTNAWALTYGMGFQLLEQDKVDNGFGQRVAIRIADPDQLNSLTRTVLDRRSRTDRSSIPSGDHLRGFGMGDVGELVTRLVAKAKLPGLSSDTESVRIRGADALSIPLGRTAADLLADLDVIREVLDRQPIPELAVLEQLVAVKDKQVRNVLDNKLGLALGDPDSARIGISWPSERIDENGTPSSFRVRGTGSPDAKDGIPDLADLLGPLHSMDPSARLDALRRMRVSLYRDSDGTEPISPEVPGLRWLAFELEHDGRRFCLHDGRWYLMDEDYAERISRQVNEIFARPSPLTLPSWPADHNEAAYNTLVAKAVGGVLLDRKLIHTDHHRRGIEACDVLGPDGTFVHVKAIESSALASHLIAQALVSTEALLADQQARQKLEERVQEQGGPSGLGWPIRACLMWGASCSRSGWLRV